MSNVRKRKVYTELGRKVAQLARNQNELAGVLGLTQQSVSGKLSGKIAVTLRDLELLSQHYNIPMAYFVTPESVTVDMARKLAAILEAGPELQRTLELVEKLPPTFQRHLPQILGILERMGADASQFTFPTTTNEKGGIEVA
jgi:transcriptional regulator with XRE-family HTH domain